MGRIPTWPTWATTPPAMTSSCTTGTSPYFDGIVILGRLEGDLAALADLEGDIDVQVASLSQYHDN